MTVKEVEMLQLTVGHHGIRMLQDFKWCLYLAKSKDTLKKHSKNYIKVSFTERYILVDAWFK